MTEKILKYVTGFTDKEDPVLSKLSRETHLKTVQPRMLSGHYQGKLLEFISKMVRPEKILEIGTFTGYSTICLAKGLKKNGIIYTIEINLERKKIIEKYFKEAKINTKVKLIFGNALNIIPEINETFDLVFIDGDKSEYLKYYKVIKEKIKPGSFIIADNVLWNGKIVEEVKKNDKAAKGIKEFNEYLKQDADTEKIILPVRDGLMLIRKK